MQTDQRIKALIPVGLLLLSYLVGRTVFQQVPQLKSLFIYPTGEIVSAFYGIGTYINSEWIFNFGQTRFILGETCSGTTFFCLLCAYLIYSMIKHKTSFMWLFLAYPITIIANAMRVLSSIYVHRVLVHINADVFGEAIHVFTGTVTFLGCLLLIASLIDRTGKKLSDGKHSPVF